MNRLSLGRPSGGHHFYTPLRSCDVTSGASTEELSSTLAGSWPCLRMAVDEAVSQSDSQLEQHLLHPKHYSCLAYLRACIWTLLLPQTIIIAHASPRAVERSFESEPGRRAPKRSSKLLHGCARPSLLALIHLVTNTIAVG